mgnify:CR=1 FL=1
MTQAFQVDYQTNPSQYKHINLAFDGEIEVVQPLVAAAHHRAQRNPAPAANAEHQEALAGLQRRQGRQVGTAAQDQWQGCQADHAEEFA